VYRPVMSIEKSVFCARALVAMTTSAESHQDNQ
jgi:hypothetical protein